MKKNKFTGMMLQVLGLDILQSFLNVKGYQNVIKRENISYNKFFFSSDVFRFAECEIRDVTLKS